MPHAVIVSTARSPIGRAYKGSLAAIRPDDLAAQMVRTALAKVPALDPADVDDLLLGCGAPGGEQGFNLARVVAVLLGHDTVPGTTSTRYCASSVQTTRMAMHAIRAGEGDVYVSAGVETVSRYRAGSSDNPPPAPGTDPRDKSSNPWLNPLFGTSRERTAERSAGGADVWRDPRELGALPDIYMNMGQTAENVAQVRGISRERQDEFALRSQRLYDEAKTRGVWEREIDPVTLPDGTVFDADDGPRPGTTLEALAGLDPVFRPDGTITAGNCCPLNDGAAALVIMSDTRAAELGITPLARIVSTGVCGLSPEIMGLGPVEASRRALRSASMTVQDVDLFEINEAFAAQVLASADELGLPMDRLNVNGGAIAMGHPFGMTGARITTTVLNALRERDLTTGLVTMCVGGGQGMAMVLERMS